VVAPARRLLLNIDVSLGAGFSVRLPVHEGDAPAGLAAAFVAQHGLGAVPNIGPLMEQLIASRMAAAAQAMAAGGGLQAP
jgi:hypothetical protein